MGFDLTFLLGLDDSDFRRRMQDSEAQVSRTAGRVGGAIQAQTAGIRGLAGALSSVAGIATGIIAPFALIGAAIGGIVAIGVRWQNQQRQIFEDAKKELELRREAMRQFDQMVAKRQSQLAGRDSPLDAEIDSIRREFEQARAAFADANKNAFEKVEDGSIGGSVKNQEAYERYLRGLEEIERIEEGAIARARNKANIDSAAQTAALHRARELQEREDALAERSAEIAAQTAAGNVAQAAWLTELQRHEDQIRKIDEIQSRDLERATRLRELEEQTHTQRMAQIEQEEAKRKELAEQQAKREQEQAQRDADRLNQLRFSNELFAEQQELERLRLTDQKEAAEAMELELEHRRNIQEIQRREGIEEAERSRLQRNEEELFALRKQRLANPATAAAATPSLNPIGFGGGFADALLSRQVLGARGDDPQRAIKSNTDKILEQVRDAVESLREIGRNFTIGLV